MYEENDCNEETTPRREVVEVMTKWCKGQWLKVWYPIVAAALVSLIVDCCKPPDRRVEAEIAQLKASTEFLKLSKVKDSAIVDHLTNQVEQMKYEVAKNDLLISVARQLSGNADTQTVERIKHQLITHFTTEFRRTYLTQYEFAKEKDATTATTQLMTTAALARGGDREAYDRLKMIARSTNDMARVAKAVVSEVDYKYDQKRLISLNRSILIEAKTEKRASLDGCIFEIYAGRLVVEAIHSATDIGDPKVVGTFVRVVKYSKSLDEVFAAILGIEQLTKQRFPALGVEEVLAWWDKHSSETKYLLPDERVDRLYTDIAGEGGVFAPGSEKALKLMDGLYSILQDDKNHNCDRVAVCALQIALRQGFVKDEKKREHLRAVIKLAIDRYGSSAYKLSDWYVYNAVYLFIYDHDNFVEFVKKRSAAHLEFEKEVKDAGFFNDTFFSSPLWPLQNEEKKQGHGK